MIDGEHPLTSCPCRGDPLEPIRDLAIHPDAATNPHAETLEAATRYLHRTSAIVYSPFRLGVVSSREKGVLHLREISYTLFESSFAMSQATPSTHDRYESIVLSPFHRRGAPVPDRRRHASHRAESETGAASTESASTYAASTPLGPSATQAPPSALSMKVRCPPSTERPSRPRSAKRISSPAVTTGSRPNSADPFCARHNRTIRQTCLILGPPPTSGAQHSSSTRLPSTRLLGAIRDCLPASIGLHDPGRIRPTGPISSYATKSFERVRKNNAR